MLKYCVVKSVESGKANILCQEPALPFMQVNDLTLSNYRQTMASFKQHFAMWAEPYVNK